MRVSRTLLIVATACLLALSAAGCGGGGGTSYSGSKPETWAATVCGAMSDWAQGLQAQSKTLTAQLAGAKDIKTVKARFVAFLENAEKSTGTMIDKVESAGPPAVKDGEALQRDLEAGLQRAKASFTRAIAKAKKLPTASPRAFATGVGEVGATIQQELTATGETFNKLGDRYDDKSLNEATSNEPACSRLSTGG